MGEYHGTAYELEARIRITARLKPIEVARSLCVKLFVWVLSLIVGVSLYGCSQPDEGIINVGTNVWPGYEPLYLAKNRELFDTRGVRFVEFTAASELLRAYRNKTIDVAALTLDEALFLIQDQPDTKIILVMDFSAGADVVIAQQYIGDLSELSGKRVGLESSALGAFVWARAMDIHAPELTDVEIINLEFNRHERAFLNQEVDVVVTFEPVKSQLIEAGGKVLFSSKEIPGEIVDVLVARESLIGRHPSQLSNLVNGWFAGLKFLNDEKTQALQEMGGRLKMDQEALAAAYDGMILLGREENKLLLSGEPPNILSTGRKVENLLLKSGLLYKEVLTENVIDSRFLSQ